MEHMMRKFYATLAMTLVAGIAVQAASIAFGFGGMLSFIQGGGVVDQAVVEGSGTGSGEIGFSLHAIVGGAVMPLAALLLVVVSFFVKVRGARMWAAIVLGAVVLQVAVAFSISDVPFLGLIHGANAIAVAATASIAARRMRQARGSDSTEARPVPGEQAGTAAVAA
jgi:hypothetical protein